MLQVWEEGTLQVQLKAQEGRKGHGKIEGHEKDKAVKVHKLSAKAAVEQWTKKQYAAIYQQTAYYNPSPQSKIPDMAFHHMQTIQVNSLNNQADNRHIMPLWMST